MRFDGFDWDKGNREKCRKHGVSLDEIESMFGGPVIVLPDEQNSRHEKRFRALAKTGQGRAVFIVFTVRERDADMMLRPISARYMHDREVKSYEKIYPDF